MVRASHRSTFFHRRCFRGETLNNEQQSGMYDRLWPLIIPPLMTVLDDYEVHYKLLGVQIVSEMLQKAPAEILRRTGVDDLLFTVSSLSPHVGPPSSDSHPDKW